MIQKGWGNTEDTSHGSDARSVLGTSILKWRTLTTISLRSSIQNLSNTYLRKMLCIAWIQNSVLLVCTLILSSSNLYFPTNLCQKRTPFFISLQAFYVGRCSYHNFPSHCTYGPSLVGTEMKILKCLRYFRLRPNVNKASIRSVHVVGHCNLHNWCTFVCTITICYDSRKFTKTCQLFRLILAEN
jgi:hypothetical protein